MSPCLKQEDMMGETKPKKGAGQTNIAFYRLVKYSLVLPIFRTYFQGQVWGIEKVPKTGKLVVVSNHASVFDPPLLGAGLPRPLCYMAKQELFSHPLFRKLIITLGAYPVNRGEADRKAIREAVARLEQGWATVIFIEGTRTKDGKVYHPKLGAALIAAKAGAPLLPVAIHGTEKILPPGFSFPRMTKITINVGDLIPPPNNNKEELEAVTNHCAQVINQLHEECSHRDRRKG